MSDLAIYILIIAFLVCCSAFFSGSEVAFFSLRSSDRELLSQSEKKRRMVPGLMVLIVSHLEVGTSGVCCCDDDVDG